jgi:hypothetical protein
MLSYLLQPFSLQRFPRSEIKWFYCTLYKLGNIFKRVIERSKRPVGHTMDGAVGIRLLIKCHSPIDSLGFRIDPRRSKLRVSMIQIEISPCTIFKHGLVPHSHELLSLVCTHVHHHLMPYPHVFAHSGGFLIVCSLCSDLWVVSRSHGPHAVHIRHLLAPKLILILWGLLLYAHGLIQPWEPPHSTLKIPT